MSVMDKMMQGMMGRMSKEEKEAMMSKMMDKFLGDMTSEDKQKMMSEMMPKMMTNMMGNSKDGMTGICKNKMEEFGMPDMMRKMMPQCLNIMLPKLSKEKRIDFILKLIIILLKQGCMELSENEKFFLITAIAKEVEKY